MQHRKGGFVPDRPEWIDKVRTLSSPDRIKEYKGKPDKPPGKPDKPDSGKPDGGKPDGGLEPDTEAPMVTITSPADGATVEGQVTIVASVSDNVGVTVVEFYVDDILMYTKTTPPFTYIWDSAGAEEKAHSISVIAEDAEQNLAEDVISVLANITPVPPDPDLEGSYFMDTPPAGDQGGEGACVPFATAYAARSIEKYYEAGHNSFSPDLNIFSAEYVYNQTLMTPGDCNSGTSIGLTLDLMVAKGVCLQSTMPQLDGNCSQQPTGEQNTEAAKYKISGYSKIEHTDIDAIKTMVKQNHPVIASIVYDNSFINAGPGFIWSEHSGSGVLPHMGVIVGYDDDKNAYKIMNSWGASWGDEGFGWIDYDFFPEVAGYYVYVIT